MIAFTRITNLFSVWVPSILVLFITARAIGAPTTIQPDESTGQDVLVYEFLPNMNLHSGGFELLLSTGDTTSGHDTRSLIRFPDLSGVTLGIGETATLNLFVIDTASAGFGVSPTPGAPVTINLHVATSAWTEAATWNTQPSFLDVATSAVLDGVNKWIRFDITTILEDWLADPSSNHGLVLTQAAPVTNGGSVAAVYNAASAATNRPFLQVVPEPTGLAVCGLMLIPFLSRRMRRVG